MVSNQQTRNDVNKEKTVVKKSNKENFRCSNLIAN
jgi:hypothetical protein